MSLFVFIFALALPAFVLSGCVKALPPTDTDSGDSFNPVGPDSPSAPTGTSQSVAYDPDLKPIFASDCVVCHGGARTYAGYSMANYTQVMRAVVPGNKSSILVRVTQRNGSMYPYFGGNRAAKAQMVFDWVVNNQAAEKR